MDIQTDIHEIVRILTQVGIEWTVSRLVRLICAPQTRSVGGLRFRSASFVSTGSTTYVLCHQLSRKGSYIWIVFAIKYECEELVIGLGTTKWTNIKPYVYYQNISNIAGTGIVKTWWIAEGHFCMIHLRCISWRRKAQLHFLQGNVACNMTRVAYFIW